MNSLKQIRAQDHSRKAAALFQSHDYENALLELSKAIFLDPYLHEAYDFRADIYTRLCDFKSAVANLKKAIMTQPLNIVYRRKLAVLLDAQGLHLIDEVQIDESRSLFPHEKLSLVEAISFFGEAINEDSLNANFWLHRALSYLRLRRYEKALQDLAQYVVIDGNNIDVFILKAKLQWKIGLRQDGFNDLQKANNIAYKLGIQHPELNWFNSVLSDEAIKVNQIATRSLLCQDLVAAERQLGSALSLNPENVDTLVLRACNFDKALDDLHRAERICQAETTHVNFTAETSEDFSSSINDDSSCTNQSGQRSTRSLPKPKKLGLSPYSATGIDLGNVARQRNLTLNDMGLSVLSKNASDVKNTFSNFQNKLYNTPINDNNNNAANSRRRKAISTMKVKECEYALAMFNKLIEAENVQVQNGSIPHVDIRFYLNRGDCYRKLKRWQQAMADYHRAFDIQPENSFNKGCFAQASIEISTAIKYNPHIAQYFLYRGETEFYLENYKLAFKDFLTALRLDPNNTDAQNALLKFKEPQQIAATEIDSIGRDVTKKQRLLYHRKKKSQTLPNLTLRKNDRKRGVYSRDLCSRFEGERPHTASIESLPGQKSRITTKFKRSTYKR